MTFKVVVEFETLSEREAVEFFHLMRTAPIAPKTIYLFGHGRFVDQWINPRLESRTSPKSPAGPAMSPYRMTLGSAEYAGSILEEMSKKYIPSVRDMLLSTPFSPEPSEKRLSETFLAGEHVDPTEMQVFKSGSARRPRKRK